MNAPNVPELYPSSTIMIPKKKKSKPATPKAKPAVAAKSPRAPRTSKLETMFRQTVETARYQLRLYVTGTSPRSSQAIANIRALCEQHLPGRYDLEVIDIYQQPALAAREQIIAAPTLIKSSPAPTRRMIGDLSNPDKILLGLNIVQRNADTKWLNL
jgi:circadian clock protein KaiB